MWCVCLSVCCVCVSVCLFCVHAYMCEKHVTVNVCLQFLGGRRTLPSTAANKPIAVSLDNMVMLCRITWCQYHIVEDFYRKKYLASFSDHVCWTSRVHSSLLTLHKSSANRDPCKQWNLLPLIISLWRIMNVLIPNHYNLY